MAAERIIKLIFKGLLPIMFFMGGIIILVSRIPGWSLILGLPIIIIGFAISINIFDDMASSTILPRPQLTECKICKKPTPTLPGISDKDTICARCRENLKRSAKS